MSELSTINNKVQAALEKLFQQHRLVFWYDEKKEMTDLFNSLDIEGVEKRVIENNEFTLKYKILIEQPKQRFLLYQPKEKPDDNNNWLLDLVLSNYEFHTEASSLYLQDLGLPQEFKSLVQEHEDFFTNQKRITELKALLEPEDRESKIRLKMLSILCACEPEWEKVLYALFAETLKGKNDKYKAIERVLLRGFLWETIERKYNYKSINPAIKDFLLQLIQDDFERSHPEGKKPTLNKDAYLFVNRWKENTKARQIFYDWSIQLEEDLNIKETIQSRQIETLLNSDTYSVVDKKIIHGIKEHITQNTLSNYILQDWIEKRRVKFFFNDYKNIYEALGYASTLLDEIRKADLRVENPKEGFEKYEKQWYKIDRLYRKYIFTSEQSEHSSLLKDLTGQIEKAYSNTFLLKLGDNWQAVVDKMSHWRIEDIMSQTRFYTQWVAPYTQRNKRIFVIISDALRYESAVELRENILKEDKYTATLNTVLGSLPSYTQLGMASLLPHTSLTFREESDTVYADTLSTKGTESRTKVLQKEYAGSIAIQAEDFMKMKANTEGREFIKPYNVIYIYHNHIDKTGDDKTSESKVFEATETELKYLLEIVKRIYNMNGSNMIITADHGYLYQHNRLEETDFTGFSPKGKVYRATRRFVLGKDLPENPSVQKWTGKALGFGDDTEAQIPKSINRIRIQGAGSRFVHGGSSLQEIVIPVLEINNTRKEDSTQVEIDIISGSSNITSNTFAVSFYQKQAVTEKMQARQIKAGFYTVEERNPDNSGKGGKLISDVITLLFNSTDTDTQAREKRQSFLFTAEASKYNGQDVYLKLEEQIEGTNQFRTYKSLTYRMLIAFSSEFDDF
jgi:uncharacterized protein (TIGR02687 family)